MLILTWKRYPSSCKWQYKADYIFQLWLRRVVKAGDTNWQGEFWNQTALLGLLSLLITNCMTLSKLHKIFELQCPQFSSITQLCLTLCDLMDWSTPGYPIHHQLLELAQTHVHQVGDDIQPSHPLSSPSPAFNLSQDQGLFKWVSSLHQVAKVLELQHQSFQWIFRTDLL